MSELAPSKNPIGIYQSLIWKIHQRLSKSQSSPQFLGFTSDKDHLELANLLLKKATELAERDHALDPIRGSSEIDANQIDKLLNMGHHKAHDEHRF